jgi:Flp pilus assembly pilin Flp
MRTERDLVKTFLGDPEGAQATIEWVLLLGVIIVPMTAVIFAIVTALQPYYSINSWVVSLPFP